MSYYKFETSISFREIAEAIVANQDMATITQFLKTFADQMNTKAQAEEENSTPLAEDVFYKTLSQALYEAIGKAQNVFREQTRLRIQQPSQEEIQAKIQDLLKRRQERLEREAVLEEKRQREGLTDEQRTYWMMFESTPVQTISFDSEDGQINVTFLYKNGKNERQKLTLSQYKSLMSAWSLWTENQTWEALKTRSVNSLGVSTV